MFGLDWWILIAATIFFNICWPPIMLTVALWFDNLTANKLLKKAQAIEDRVSKAIQEEKEKEKLLDEVAVMIDEYADKTQKIMAGTQTQIERKLDEKVEQAEKKIQAAAGRGSGGGVDTLLQLAAGALGGG